MKKTKKKEEKKEAGKEEIILSVKTKPGRDFSRLGKEKKEKIEAQPQRKIKKFLGLGKTEPEKKKKIMPRIVIENNLPNSDVRNYHTTAEISHYSIHNFWRPLRRQSSDSYLEQVGRIGTQLLMDIFAISGVNEVFIKPYELHVSKGKAFDWEDIEPAIIEALKVTFVTGKPEEIEVIRAGAEIPKEEKPSEEKKDTVEEKTSQDDKSLKKK